MKRRTILSSLVVFAVISALAVAGCDKQKNKQTTSQDAPLAAVNGMRSLQDFSSIKDDRERALAIYQEIDAVLSHPRCANCHPAGDTPYQGNIPKPHQPLVVRGEDNFGAPGMRCGTCHGEANFENVPGKPSWHLAPREMAWEGKTPGEICAQIKDPERNGGKTLAQLTDHMQHDALVSYGWEPPEHLEPVPGSQALFGQLFQAWVDAGAPCPPAEKTR